jgi:ribosomal protein L11 methyltransferase
MTDEAPQETDWPYLVLAMPADADPEAAARLTQAALDAGALGGEEAPGELRLYLPREATPEILREVDAALRAEADALGMGDGLAWRAGHLADAPWATAWREYFQSTPVGQRMLVRPDWEQGTPTPQAWAGRETIWLRPGLGFGTGRHETTRLAMEMVEAYMAPGLRVLDFGSGSGVLSLAAVRLGAGEVWAIERDPQANENAVDNLEINQCADRIRLLETDTPSAAEGTFDLIVCNVLPQFALPQMAGLAARLRSNASTLIYSGFLADQSEEIERALAQSGLVIVEARSLAEWGAAATRRR